MGGMTRGFVCIFIIGVALLLACGRQSTREDLAEAERLLRAGRYDSAAWILEERMMPSLLADSDRADYGLLLTWLHTGQRRSLVNDSLIVYSVDYYKRHASERLLLAYKLKDAYSDYTSAGVEERTALLREAIDTASVRGDTSGHIIDLYQSLVTYYLNKGRYTEAIAVAKEWEASPFAGFKEEARYLMGLSYGRLSRIDSADYYLRMVADSAERKDMGAFAIHSGRNYVDFLATSDPRAAIERLRAMEVRFPGWRFPGSYVLPWLNLGVLDSARKYLEEDKTSIAGSGDLASHALNLAYQIVLDVKEGKPANASPLGRYCDSVYMATVRLERTERERLFAQNRLREENLRLEMRRQRTVSTLLIVSLSFVLLMGAVVLYVRNRRNRLIEMEERLEALRQLLEEATRSSAEASKPDSAFFRKVLLRQLGIIRLVAATPTQQNKELLQRMTRITNEDVPVDSLLVWDDLYPIVDAVYDRFHERLLRLAAGRLSEKEIQLCCLLCAGFSTKEISVVTQQSVRTIYQRKTDIRHKLGMDEKEDIVAFIQRV